LFVVALLLGLFIFLDIGLFGWLLFRSLSKREIERVLLETREEAEGLAERLAGTAEEAGGDLYTVTAMEREVQTYIDSILKQRKFVRTVEVVDGEGRLVFRGAGETTLEVEPSDSLVVEKRERPSRIEERPFEREATFPLEVPLEELYDLNLPIGELGFLRVGISQGELQRSIETLRSELVQKTAVVAALTLVVLLLAFAIIWRLWKRGQTLQEQAREAERMAYIGTLASGLAHEIRNPLNSLNLNMQLLEEELSGRLGAPAGVQSSGKLMSITRDEIHRLERLVTDFLQYARPRPLELEEIPAVELLERCREVLVGEFRARGAQLRVEDSSGGVKVRVDRGQMNQLLLNLVQNALAASETAEDKGVAEVRLAVSRESGRVVFEVEDRGSGMSQDVQSQMFDLFYSTRKGGTGLGLPVVRRIAETHHADLTVVSRPGEGTLIRLALPEALPSNTPDAVSAPQASINASKSSWVKN
jgi:signal transduction histidine kinase